MHKIPVAAVAPKPLKRLVIEGLSIRRKAAPDGTMLRTVRLAKDNQSYTNGRRINESIESIVKANKANFESEVPRVLSFAILGHELDDSRNEKTFLRHYLYENLDPSKFTLSDKITPMARGNTFWHVITEFLSNRKMCAPLISLAMEMAKGKVPEI